MLNMYQLGFACVVAVVAFLFLPAPFERVHQASTPQNLSAVGVTQPTELTKQLSSFLKFRTIGAHSPSRHVPVQAREHFQEALGYLEKTYEAAFRSATVTKIAEYSLLLEFKGSDPSLAPFALLSHYDVVPADPTLWTYPPFSGTVENGYIWGRGALDLKGNVIAILHAVNQLAASETFTPKRGFIIALGHDEEVGGLEGAHQIVRYLQSRDVVLDFVLDEGGFIIQDGLPPLTRSPFAIVGTAEKDYSVLRLNVTSAGGHSSMPPVDGSSVSAVMSRILTQIEKHPSALRMQSPTTDFVMALADVTPSRAIRFLMRWAAYRPFCTLFARVMSWSSTTNALVATTAAVTTLHAGGTNNVLPQSGSIIINLRHLPGHTPQQAKLHLEQMFSKSDRRRITVEIIEFRKTGHISPNISPSFDLIRSVIQATRWSITKDEVGPKLMVAPYLVVGGTDAKHYAPLTRNIYRFQPVPVNRTAGDISTIHGTDERIRIDDLQASCRFFLQLITEASASDVNWGAREMD